MDSSRISLLVSRLTTRGNRRFLFFAAALLVAGTAALPLFSQTGLLNTRGGGDSPFLLQRLQQLTIALSDGHFPVRWMPDANYGYGYPFYNYYAPLSIYIAAFFRLLGFAFVPAIKLAQLAGFLVAAGSMFVLGRRWFANNWAGLLAAGAYTFAPFHMVNVYVRGDSLAEFWAMAFYPVIVVSIDLLLSKLIIRTGAEPITKAMPNNVLQHNNNPRLQAASTRKAIAILALLFASLVLSHNISALIFTPFALMFIVLGFITYAPKPWRYRNSNLTILFLPFAALIFGLVLSAWFWLPALAEQNLAQLDPITTGYFNFSIHFRSNDLVQSGVLFDYDVEKGRAFSMGLVQALLAVAGLLVLLTVGARNKTSNEQEATPHKVAVGYRVFIVVGLVVATFMITPLSRFLWEQLPLLPFVQFPWRFLSVQAFFVSLATAGLALLPGRRILVPVLLIALMLSSLADLKLDFLHLSDSDVTSERLAQYEWFTSNIGTTVSAEYLPTTVIPRTFTSDWLNIGERDSVQILSGDLSSSEIIERQAVEQRWQFMSASDGAKLTIPTIDWPDWGKSTDQESLTAGRASGSGLIEIELPLDELELGLALARTPVRWLGELIALAGLVILVILLRPWRSISGRQIVIVGAILLVIALLTRLWPEKNYTNEDLTWDFAQMAYLHHAEDGVTFENGAVMGSYEYSAEQVAVGELLTITLDWKSSADSEAMLALYTPAINRHKRTPLVTSLVLPVRTGQVAYPIQIPKNAPAGLFIPRLTMVGAQSLTPSGSKRGDLFLRPVRIVDDNEPAAMEGRLFDARLLAVDIRPSQVLDVQLQWATAESATENLNFSLRLIDNQGRVLTQVDNQPGFGFLPSSLWPKETWVDDWLALPLPDNLPLEDEQTPLALVARLYNVATGDVVLTKRLGELQILDNAVVIQNDSVIATPSEPMRQVSAEFIDNTAIIRLLGYDFQHDSEAIRLNLYWESLDNNLKDYHHFVHLIDLENGRTVAQHDAIPRNNSYPTSQWSKGEIVVDPLLLDLEDIPSGRYVIYVGLYRPEGNNTLRLSVIDENAQSGADGRFLLPETIEIDER